MEPNRLDKLKRVIPRGIQPHLGALRRWRLALPARTLKQKQRLLDDPSLSVTERELLLKASSRIHYNDGMYKGDGDHYYKVGLSAIRNIESALELVGRDNPRIILDLPCGYGRVLRFLVHRFPAAKITACELDAEAVDFCVREFGASPAYSSPDLAQLSLPSRFDLIWCGSLITHLSEPKIAALLDFFRRHLPVDGLVVFTTQGDFVADRLPRHDFNYGLFDEQILSLVENYARSGIAYTDYPDREHYGLSLTSPGWIRNQIRQVGGLEQVYFRERGWDDHQDVYGFVRRD